ncbi:MAG TPA: hypothetical protein VG078_09250 [Acidimicrobiales bacterium]|nr:hypothetical protein [Acidimicrobiales bacterium]
MAAVTVVAVLLRGPESAVGPNLALLVLGFAALAVLVAAERRRRCLTRRLVLGVSGALLVVAVVTPPAQSADVWSYAMYGRMVSEYRANPYRHTPAEYQTDPIGQRVSRFWIDSPSVYGPLFTAISSAGMAGAGRSATLARLFFQGLAAVAVAACLVLVDRRTRDPVALALIGVNPVVVVSVVNGAHNDALVGLALLGGVLLAAARRPAWAGAALAAGALVKVGAVLPLAALAVWVWARCGRRSAAVLAGTAAAVGLAGVVAAGAPDVLAALGDAQARVTGGSVWAWAHRRIDSEAGLRLLAWGATVAAAALTFLLAARRPREQGLVLVVGGSVVAYLLLGTYVVPWYLVWGLPVLVLLWRWRVAWMALAHAALLHLATARPPVQGPDPRSAGVARLQGDLYEVVAPLFAATAAVVITVAMVRRIRRTPSGDGDVGDERAADAHRSAAVTS